MDRRFCAACGHELSPAATQCADCGHRVGAPVATVPPRPATPPPTAPSPAQAVPPPPPTPAAGAPPPGAPAAPAPSWRRPLLLGGGVLAAVVLGIAAFSLLGDDGHQPPVAEAPVEDEAAGSDDPATAPEAVRLEAIGAPVPDAFTPPQLQVEEEPVAVAASLEAVALEDTPGVAVDGAAPGLYGGTRDLGTCDQTQLVAFLETNAAESAAWAAVHGIDASDIAAYVDTLTPVVLTRDTRVTNHGFTGATANPLQSVLQAGTAVLVDDTGVPRVKCACGNPLLPPAPTATPTYSGTAWDGFDEGGTVTVTPAPPQTTLVLTDVITGQPFTRSVGADWTDADVSVDVLCDLYPQDPSCAGPAAIGDPEQLFDTHNILGVANGPTAPTVMSFLAPVRIHSIETYHWNAGQGAAPGTIGLVAADGTTFGPWPVTSTRGIEGAPDLYWLAELPDGGLVLPAGDYEIVDSGADTWAWNEDTGGRGMVKVFGWSTGVG